MGRVIFSELDRTSVHGNDFNMAFWLLPQPFTPAGCFAIGAGDTRKIGRGAFVKITCHV